MASLFEQDWGFVLIVTRMDRAQAGTCANSGYPAMTFHSIAAWLIAMSIASSALAQPATQTLVVNNRTYTLPADTPVVIDGEPSILADLLGRPAGMQLRWDSTGTRGTVPVPVFSYTLIGPVTRIDPIEVLGQPVTITGDTVIEGFKAIGELEPGAPMIVAGVVDPNGSLMATLAERRGAQGNKYLLSGYAEQIVANEPRLRIGSQWIATAGVFFTDCPGDFPAIGDYLELRADSIPDFEPGDAIDTLVDARCASPVPLGTPGAQGFLEGIVGTGIDGESFMLGPITVRYDETTVFEFGGPDDLEPGVDLSTEGVFIDATTFDADSVEFVRPVVRFEAPMTPADVTPGIAVRPLGVTVNFSAQVRDEDGILANGLTSPAQVEVRGWVDRAGVAFATRVRERGDPTANDVDLRGPVDTFNRPLLVVQGLNVDASSALFLDADGASMTADAFFAEIRLNHMIDLGAAQWNVTTRTLSGGTLTLLGYEHTVPVPGAPNSIVSGTVRSYGLADPIFAHGFDPPAQ